jgi:ligand-binding sensor domain-containing protein/signal transduction histidine kinase
MNHNFKQRYFPVLVIILLVVLFYTTGCSARVSPGDSQIPPLPVVQTDTQGNLDADILVRNIFQNPTLRFDHISIQQGLSNSAVTAGAQDEHGIIWFGTFDGLNKYNGYEFVVYRHNSDDNSSISDNIIYDMYADGKGSLWIGTDNGLSRFDTQLQVSENYSSSESDITTISDNVINVIIPDQNAGLWIGTESGLNFFDIQTGIFTRYYIMDDDRGSVLANVILSLYQDSDGILWVGTEDGLYLLNPQTQIFRPPSPSLRPYFESGDMALRTIQELQDGSLWLGTNQGVLSINDERNEVHWYQTLSSDQNSLSDATIMDIFEDRNGMVWVATTKGLNLFNSELNQFIQIQRRAYNPYSLSDNLIYHIFQDKSGILWFLTAGGVDTFNIRTKQFLHYFNIPEVPNSLVNNLVLSILEDKNGYLWIGTANGLDRLDRKSNQFRHFLNNKNNFSSLSDSFITALLEDANGNLWIGTDQGGLNWYDPANETFLHFPSNPAIQNSLSNNSISVMLQDRDGILWIGTATGILDRMDPKSMRFEHYVLETRDPVNQLKSRIRAIIQSRNGDLWLGTSYGLYRMNPATTEIIRFTHDSAETGSLSDDFILSLYEDHEGLIWIGTYGGGLNVYDARKNTFKNYTHTDGLANDSVYGILEDARGYLWLSTNHGISRFYPQDESFVNYDVRDGLQSNEFNERAYFQNSAGEMFFGGVNGLTIFHPEHIKVNSISPATILTRLDVGGQPVAKEISTESLQTVTLKWPENFFEFSFAALNYFQQEENQYAYFLEGFDKTWNMNGSLRFGRYTNLPGGTYTLHLNAANEDGVWNPITTRIAVNVIPPLWEMPLFQLGIVLLVAIIAGGSYLMKMRSIQVRNRALEQLVEERTLEIQQRQYVAEGLRDVLFLINSNRSLEESLNFIVSAAHRLTHADHVLLLGIRVEPVSCVTVRRSQKNADQIDDSPVETESDELIHWLAKLAKLGESLVVPNLYGFIHRRNEMHLLQFIQYQSMLVIPILSGDDLFGSLVLMYEQHQDFNDEELEMADSFADQAALAIGNSQLRERVEQMAIVAERNRLARDLHDAVTQTLFSASMISEALPTLYEADPEEGRQLLTELGHLSRGALAEMRTLLIELRPSVVVEAKLLDLFRQLAEAAIGRTGVQINVKVEIQEVLPEDVHISFYRIAQESLNNVVKHARASHVDLWLTPLNALNGKSGAVLLIRDDGIGFDPATVRTDRFGLKSIQERSQSIGAQFSLESREGCGTLIKVEWQGRLQ